VNKNGKVQAIINVMDAKDHELLVSKFRYGKIRKNELLFFFKPECFPVGKPEYISAIIEMVLEKFEQFDVEISGILLLGGKRLEELSIMDRHYGFINKLSRTASQIVTDEEVERIKESLDIDDMSRYKILGGHEFLKIYKDFDESSLDEFWAEKKSAKLRSGFYIQKYDVNGDKIILVNGFHPAQLRHFTHPSHKIIVFLLHSDTDWNILKNDLVGNTFPEKAIKGSIRDELFKNNQKYGLDSVSISNNCVHLSAGPFEALFEMNNFLAPVECIDFNMGKSNMYVLMKEKGIKKSYIESSIQNPKMLVGEKQTDLFTFTEDTNSDDAISGYINCNIIAASN